MSPCFLASHSSSIATQTSLLRVLPNHLRASLFMNRSRSLSRPRRSKYRPCFKYVLQGSRAVVFQTYNRSQRPLAWYRVPLVKTYRNTIYMLDGVNLPEKIRWIKIHRQFSLYPPYSIEKSAAARIRRSLPSSRLRKAFGVSAYQGYYIVRERVVIPANRFSD